MESTRILTNRTIEGAELREERTIYQDSHSANLQDV